MPSHNASVHRASTNRIVGIAEIAEFAKVTRARAGQLVREPWFPEYFDHMAMGTCWDRKLAFKALRDHGYPKPEESRPLRKIAKIILP